MSVHPRYIVKDPSASGDIVSSIPVLRTSDNALFLASKIPRLVTKDLKKDTYTNSLASVILPTAAIPLTRILNHPNIVSIIDIVHTSGLPGGSSAAGPNGDLTIWEDMDAGLLTYLLPAAETLPSLSDEEGWRILAAQNFQRPSLPESLCWHVLRSISRALLWLHLGIKETAGIPGELGPHDSDWQPILIMDVSPGQIWFQKSKGEEYYGPCKLGGFQYAKVCGGRVVKAQKVEDAPLIKQYYWAPEVYKDVSSPTRASEIYSLGAVIYTMMTGMPPPRHYDHSWQISRMNDKGFTEGIKGIVADMLMLHPEDRPNALRLVDRVDDEWARWRSTTREGREFIDVDDKRVAARIGGTSRIQV